LGGSSVLCGGQRLARRSCFAHAPLRCSGVGRAAELAALRFAPLRSNSRGGHVDDARQGAPTLPPVLLATAEIALAGHRRTRSRAVGTRTVARQCGICKATHRGARAGSRIWSAEKRKGECRRAQRASCSDSLRLSERSAKRAVSSAARPNAEQRRVVAAGDRSSEASRPVRPGAWLCRKAQDQQTC
jgi:hypothetical protein